MYFTMSVYLISGLVRGVALQEGKLLYLSICAFILSTSVAIIHIYQALFSQNKLYNDLRWEVVTCFVGICGIVDHFISKSKLGHNIFGSFEKYKFLSHFLYQNSEPWTKWLYHGSLNFSDVPVNKLILQNVQTTFPVIITYFS